MRKLAQEYDDKEIVQQVVAQIPWRSNIVLLNKLKSDQERLWYAKKTVENGWTCRVAEWQTRLVRSLPEKFRSSLPSIEQLEEELSQQ